MASVSRRRRARNAASLAVALVATAPLHSTPVDAAPTQQPGVGWKELDANRDGRFDRADIERIMAGPNGQPTIDANRDGKKNVADLWHMLGLLTRWDADGNGAVDARDSDPAGRLQLPRSVPEARVLAIATAVANEYATQSQDLRRLEEALGPGWKPQPADAEPAERAGYHDNMGLGALIVRNLELAAWNFAEAVRLDPARPSALSNLGFALLEGGRHEEALALLGRSLDLEPNTCAVHANVATAFVRNRQHADALRHYRAAARSCPTVGQYRTNVAATLLRMDSTGAALGEFRQAETLEKQNLEVQLMIWSIAPPKEPDLRELGSAWERQRSDAAQELRKEGYSQDMNPYQPWAETSPRDRINFVLGEAGGRAVAEFDASREALRASTQKQIEAILEPLLPRNPGCAGLHHWFENYIDAIRAVWDLGLQADRRPRELDVLYQRKKVMYQMALDPLILNLVLTEAQDRMAYQGRAGFLEAMRSYDLIMEDLRNDLKSVYSTTGFAGDIDPNGYGEAATGAFMVHFLYLVAAGLECPGVSGEGELKAPEFDFGVDVAVVGFSLKPSNCELRVRAGQLFMVAGTWSPRSGFGFEHGAGFEYKFGPLSLGGGKYTRFGSDGSITDSASGGGSIGVGPVGANASFGSSTVAFAAEHAPIGVSEWLADMLGCD